MLPKLINYLGSTLAGVNQGHIAGLAIYGSILAAIIAGVSSFIVAIVNSHMARAAAIATDIRKYRQKKLGSVQTALRDSMADTRRFILHPTSANKAALVAVVPTGSGLDEEYTFQTEMSDARLDEYIDYRDRWLSILTTAVTEYPTLPLPMLKSIVIQYHNAESELLKQLQNYIFFPTRRLDLLGLVPRSFRRYSQNKALRRYRNLLLEWEASAARL